MSTRGRTIGALAAAGALVIVGAVIGVLAMQDNEPATPAAKLQDVAASQAALPACTAVFVAGDKIDAEKAKAGCKDAQGNLQMEAYHTCTDGRLLFTTDVVRGWGFGGDMFHQTIDEVAADPAFSSAYQACRS